LWYQKFGNFFENTRKISQLYIGKQKKFPIYTRTWDPFCWEHSNFLTLWLACDRLWSSNSDLEPKPKYHLLPMCIFTHNATGNSPSSLSSAGSCDLAWRETDYGGQQGGVNRVCNAWGYGGCLTILAKYGLKKPGDFTVSEGHGYPTSNKILFWAAYNKVPPYNTSGPRAQVTQIYQ
jgi:hypothetical protein